MIMALRCTFRVKSRKKQLKSILCLPNCNLLLNLSALALIYCNVHAKLDVDHLCKLFVEKNPRRMTDARLKVLSCWFLTQIMSSNGTAPLGLPRFFIIPFLYITPLFKILRTPLLNRFKVQSPMPAVARDQWSKRHSCYMQATLYQLRAKRAVWAPKAPFDEPWVGRL